MNSAVAEAPLKLAIRADGADVRLASTWLEETANARHTPPDQIYRLDLCLNEALANIIEHGGIGAQNTPVNLTLDFTLDDEGRAAALTVSDGGLAFDPLSARPKGQALSLEDAEPGGLGLGLISSFADEVSYHYQAGRNILAFVVRWSPDR